MYYINHILDMVNIRRCVLLVFGLLYTVHLFAQDASPEAIAQGESIFKANCAQCHAIHDQVVGPALKDVEKRWKSEAELINFIKYPQKTIDGGNAYAKKLYEQYKQYMPNHDFLKDDEIKNILAWVKVEANKAPVATAAEATATTGAATAAASGTDSEILTIVLAVLLVVLLLILVVLVLIVSVISKYLKDNSEKLDDADLELVNQKFDLGKFLISKPVLGGVAFIFVMVLAKAGFDAVYGIGIQQGYAPRQPIAFSHKLHAGMYEIDCGYCHTGAYKGKSATIPSTNICLNCHNVIKTNSPEIQKLWTAVEKNRPIEWVRVHNLPDLAYFNHSQHTVAGGIECQTCHGPIQEMEVVQQYSSLTMGWCINCHRETVVKAEGNAYYDKLLEFHQANAKGEMHVEDIGGLECSKCHY